MLTAWRIVKARHSANAFDGEGARLYGGRWNSPGIPAVYASENRALAMLEVLAGLGEPAALGPYVMVSVQLDESLVTTLKPSDLPEDWNSYPPPSSVQSIGDQWISEARSVALQVPSVLVPAEWNYVLNPRHADFAKLVVGQPEPIAFEPRILR